jgi:hypothetical protein
VVCQQTEVWSLTRLSMGAYDHPDAPPVQLRNILERSLLHDEWRLNCRIQYASWDASWDPCTRMPAITSARARWCKVSTRDHLTMHSDLAMQR